MKSKLFQIELFPMVILILFFEWNVPSFGTIRSQQQLQEWTPQSQDSHRLRKELINILEMSIRWGGRDIHVSKETWEWAGFRDATGKDHDDFDDDKSRMTAIDELAWNESGANGSTRKFFVSYTDYAALNRDIAICFPDVCESPPPTPPVSIPYPKTAKTSDTKTGTKDTKVDVKGDSIQSKTVVTSVQRPPLTIVPVRYTRQQEIVRFRKAMKELLLRKE